MSCSSSEERGSARILSLTGEGCEALGLGLRAETLFCLDFERELSLGPRAGVWKGFALALVVFWPRGARTRGPSDGC